MKRTTDRHPRRGVGLLEATIAVTLLAVAVFATFSLLDSSRRFADASLEVSSAEGLLQDLIHDIGRELSSAAVYTPESQLIATLDAGDVTGVTLNASTGFPPTGWIVLERGTANEEVVRYTGMEAAGQRLTGLTRGVGCTEDATHAPSNVNVLWRGMAELLDDQTNPPAGSYDGVALGEEGDEFFRGQGSGLVYQLPIDTGGPIVDEEGIEWGAEVPEIGPTTTGYSALYFDPRDTYDEARFGVDLNNDEDTDDTFDVGQIRLVTWDITAPDRFMDIGIGPSAVLQERCAWGSDLDGDGNDDPLFLVNETRRTVHVRLHVIGLSNPERPITRSLESVFFLRNDPDA